ncbi:hypothetical protein AOLI_G00058380 [Acnodon oligacanthus]
MPGLETGLDKKQSRRKQLIPESLRRQRKLCRRLRARAFDPSSQLLLIHGLSIQHDQALNKAEEQGLFVWIGLELSPELSSELSPELS